MKPDTPYVLWLPSWYPSEKDLYTGDFVQRSARALAMQIPVHVVYFVKHTAYKKIKQQETITGGLTETIIYIPAVFTGVHFLDRYISFLKLICFSKKKIKSIIKQKPAGQPIIVEVQVAMNAGLLALWMKKKWGIPYCITEHWAGYYKQAANSPDQQRTRLFWWLTKQVFKQATFFQPVTNDLGKTINKNIASIVYSTVPNVVDTSLFYYKPKPETLSVFKFIHVSTLGYQKNILGILSVVENVLAQKNTPVFHLRLVGHPPPEIINMVEKSTFLKEVISFSGMLTYQQVADEMRQANAMLMFSRYENLPCVLLEAMCCGLPVITTRVGGINEHINSQNGLLIENEDKIELEAAIKSMVTNYHHFDTAQIAEEATSKYGPTIIGTAILANYRLYFSQYF